MTTKLRTGDQLRCRCQVLAIRLHHSVSQRFLSVEDLAQRQRFRTKGLVHRRSRSRPSYTSLLLRGRTSRPTSRTTLWAARGRAQQDPHHGVLAAALDRKFPFILRFDLDTIGVDLIFDELTCCSPVGYVDYIQLDAEDVES